MNNNPPSVNLVIRHPSRKAKDISLALGWRLVNSWSVGDERRTPAGTVLAGHRAETMCSFDLEFAGSDATSAIAVAVQRLWEQLEYVRGLSESGGKWAINVRLTGGSDTSVTLLPEVVRDLAEVGAEFSVEWFPGERQKPQV